jgi:thiol-disulfide isomerase/thioredoxin
MTAPWIAAFIVQWILVLGLAGVVLGVLRRTTAALSVTAPSPQVDQGPPPGAPLPLLEGTDIDGQPTDTSDLVGDRFVLLALSPGCGPCKALAEDLDGAAPQLLARVVVASPGTDLGPLGLPGGVRTVALGDRRLSEVLGVTATPYALAVAADGIVEAARIVNTADDVSRLLGIPAGPQPVSLQGTAPGSASRSL